MLLTVFQTFADHPLWIALSLVACVASCCGMIAICEGISHLPDAQFGFSLEFMENLNVDNYMKANTLDLAVVIPSYTLGFGGLAILAARRQGYDEKKILWALMATVVDLIETCTLRFICHQPTLFWVRFTSIANQIKYSLGGVVVFGILFELLRPSPKDKLGHKLE